MGSTICRNTHSNIIIKIVTLFFYSKSSVGAQHSEDLYIYYMKLKQVNMYMWISHATESFVSLFVFI